MKLVYMLTLGHEALAALVGESLRRYQAGEPLLYPVKIPDGA